MVMVIFYVSDAMLAARDQAHVQEALDIIVGHWPFGIHWAPNYYNKNKVIIDILERIRTRHSIGAYNNSCEWMVAANV